MSAAVSRPALVLGTLAWLVAAAGGPAAVVTVDSPRLNQVTCQGLTVRQTGLPASTKLVIAVTDPTTGRKFARQESVSSAAGVLDTQVAAPFDGASELVVEVEVERVGQDVEFAEAVHEFTRPCPAGLAPAGAAGWSRS